VKVIFSPGFGFSGEYVSCAKSDVVASSNSRVKRDFVCICIYFYISELFTVQHFAESYYQREIREAVLKVPMKLYFYLRVTL